MSIKKFLLACTAMSAFAPGSAWAAEAADNDGGITDIVVTARRTEESSQKVPVAVTAFGSEQLAALDIKGIGDIGKTVPNLDVQRQFGSASAPQFYLRGISTGSLKFETDAGIGLYIDGVYLGRPAGTAFDLADIERVEVMRGPQATLFGRNSTGGAINFVTSAPTGELGVKGELLAGNFDHFKGKVSVNLPAMGALSMRVSYLHDENRGYVTNLAAGTTYTFAAPFGKLRAADTFGAERTDAVSLALRLKSDNFTADYKFDYTDKTSTQLAQQLLAGSSTLSGTGACFGGAPSSSYLTSVCLDLTTPSNLKIQGHSLTLNYDMNDAISFKSISAYRKLDEFVGGNDIDGGARTDFLGSGRPFVYISSLQDRHQDQFTQEVQLLGKAGNIDWILGGFYFRESGRDNNPVFIGDVFPTGVTITPRNGVAGVGNTIDVFGVPSDYFAGTNATIRNKSVAGYAHLAYKTDNFELAGGVRYTKDNRDETVLAGGIVPFAVPAKTYTASSDHWDFDATATYIINEDVRTYLRFATGYLSGGVLGGVTFKPETVENYEAGLKADLLDRKLRINASVFHAQRHNVQTLGFTPAAGTFLYSSPKASNTGFELELTAKPVKALTLSATYGYLDDKPGKDGLSGAAVASLAPKHTLSLGAQYDSPNFNDGSHFQLRVDGFYRSKRLSDPVTTTTTATTLLPHMDVNARASLIDLPMGGAKVRVSAFAQNLTNNHKLEFARDLGNGMIIGTFQVPRTWGLEVGFGF